MTLRLRRALIALGGEEHGQALILAMAIVLVGLLLGVAAVGYALNESSSGTRDERARAAQQAADAGIAEQLYLESDQAAVGYDIPGSGTLGVSALVDCVLPPGGVPTATSLIGYVNSVGQCVPIGTGSAKCTNTQPEPIGCAPAWNPTGNEAYYESEFFNNAVQQSSTGSTGNSFDIQFPEIVSLGCHTTTQPTTSNTTAATTACQAGTGDSYSRRLALLAPTAPLQAIEAGNDATVYGNGLLTNLATPLEPVASALGDASSLLGVETLCANPLLSTLLATVGSLLTTLGLTSAGVQATCTEVTSLQGITLAAINGNISAAHEIFLPSTVVGVNTTGLASTTGGILSAVNTIVSSLGTVATNLTSANSTFEYGSDSGSNTGDICNVSYAGSNPPSSTKCFPQTDGSVPVTAAGASLVQANAGTCVAGEPSSDCNLERPTFKISTAPATAIPTGLTYTGTAPTVGSSAGTHGYGILTIPTGTTATFAAGTYVFCGVYSLGTITTSGGAQIFILAPGSNGCSSTTASGSVPDAGSFVACNGISNTLTGGGLDGVSSVVNPSAFQVYVQGDTSYNRQSADTAVSACPYTTSAYTAPGGSDPDTQVYVGNTATATTQAFVIYAPASEVTINSTSIFEGSAIGWNVDATAAAVIQDFDLGNYPLSSVINAYQIAQSEQCTNAVVPLTNSPPTYNTSNPGSITTGADIAGC